MGFWDDYLEDYAFNPEQAKTFTTWYRLPDDWFADGSLVTDKREALLRFLYGASWRMGNGDGSRFVILSLDDHTLTPTEAAERPWARVGGSCFALANDGTLAKQEPDAF